ncbi:MAG: Xaa-Pro peptidase family protein [Pseudomonadota bacterium]
MTPPRGFPPSEFEERLARAQALMAHQNLAALLLTTEPELRYYSGFLTRFWESPTRPWFLVVPASGKPIAVIPSIGAHLMGQTWIDDIRTWAAPDYEDDGIGLLANTLREVAPEDGWIGLADGLETHVRMPRTALSDLTKRLGTRALVSDGGLTQQLRNVKSKRETAKITHAVRIAERAFLRLPEVARIGVGLDRVFRDFQRLCLEEGADWVPYLAGAAGPNGYGDVISPATDTPLSADDILMLDTGLVWDGYFCDFDRNVSLGPPSAAAQSAHHRLIEATQAGFETAKPGARMSDLYHAMTALLDADDTSSRFGHGLGMQLTEGPSIIASDDTVLEPGMVLTLEPCITVAPGKLMVHEENIVIRDAGAEWLTHPAGPNLRVIT